MEKTIIKFWGPGCPNCTAITPHLNAVKAQYPDITFKEINTADDPKTADKYEVTTLPTLIFEKGGDVVARMMGLKPKVLIIKKIDEVF